VVCSRCKKRFITFQQLANHKRRQVDCKLQQQPAAGRVTGIAGSPQRQFNAFRNQGYSFSPSSSPFPDLAVASPLDLPDPGVEDDALASPDVYEHTVSPEPNTSAVGQQAGPRFEPLFASGPRQGEDEAAPEDPAEIKKQEYVTFIKQCSNGKGLSRYDQNWLLCIADVPGLKNDADVQQYLDTLPRPVSRSSCLLIQTFLFRKQSKSEGINFIGIR
jgi:hypothetical protein